MKYTWDEQDIKPGMYVYRGRCSDNNSVMSLATTAHKICYIPWEGLETKFGLVSITDGCITLEESAAALASRLNEGEYAPLPSSLLEKMIASLRDQNEGFRHGYYSA